AVVVLLLPAAVGVGGLAVRILGVHPVLRRSPLEGVPAVLLLIGVLLLPVLLDLVLLILVLLVLVPLIRLLPVPRKLLALVRLTGVLLLLIGVLLLSVLLRVVLFVLLVLPLL
ncbi:hypothetical protein ADK38_09280, partial [Streptomyces varsoviensis]